jgi:carbohydrate-binding DOMON domain-containing protein
MMKNIPGQIRQTLIAPTATMTATPTATATPTQTNRQAIYVYDSNGCGLCTPERLLREWQPGEERHWQRHHLHPAAGIRAADGGHQRDRGQVLLHHLRQDP